MPGGGHRARARARARARGTLASPGRGERWGVCQEIWTFDFRLSTIDFRPWTFDFGLSTFDNVMSVGSGDAPGYALPSGSAEHRPMRVPIRLISFARKRDQVDQESQVDQVLRGSQLPSPACGLQPCPRSAFCVYCPGRLS